MGGARKSSKSLDHVLVLKPMVTWRSPRTSEPPICQQFKASNGLTCRWRFTQGGFEGSPGCLLVRQHEALGVE